MTTRVTMKPIIQWAAIGKCGRVLSRDDDGLTLHDTRKELLADPKIRFADAFDAIKVEVREVPKKAKR